MTEVYLHGYRFSSLRIAEFLALLLVLTIVSSTSARAEEQEGAGSASKPKENSVVTILDGHESSSAVPEKEDPLVGILADLRAEDPAPFVDDSSVPQSSLERAIAALHYQIVVGAKRLDGYKNQQTQIVLSRQHSPSPNELAADGARRTAINTFGQKLESYRSLVERGRSSRAQCLSRDEKSLLNRGVARNCDTTVRSITEGVRTIREDSHNLDLAIAAAVTAHASGSRGTNNAPILLNPWDRDIMPR